ncbi:MAG TPA: hypothetical protein VG820_08280 [Fimbriimonadaceae bacterium]|nr:hypothetical protein [Fimbriimonadaceae bacterium]
MANKATGGLQTEFEFTLPRGYVDSHGTLHKKGRMRLATAMDEIAPLRDPRVKANQAYLVIILLARVVTQLGSVETIDTGVIENLFSADLSFLQDFYRRINDLSAEEESAQEQESSVGE